MSVDEAPAEVKDILVWELKKITRENGIGKNEILYLENFTQNCLLHRV